MRTHFPPALYFPLWAEPVGVVQVFGLFNDLVYAGGAYLIYMDWKANPTGCAAPAPPTV